MSLIKRLFGKTEVNDKPVTEDEQLVPVPIPALTALLMNLEESKGSPLTQEEVLEIRDKAVCMMLPIAIKLQMDSSRGYKDIDLENVWQEWQSFKETVEPVGEPKTERYTDRIKEYCESENIEIPVGFYRHSASRFVVIYKHPSPKLVAKTWHKQEDVVYYLQKYAGDKAIRILDFKDRQEFIFANGKIHKSGVSF